MIKVTGVRFRQAGKVYYFDPKNPETGARQPRHCGDCRGIEYGTVIVPPKDITDDESGSAVESSHSCGDTGR